MSHDTLMLLRTPLPAVEIRAALVHDPALADLELIDHGESVGLGSGQVNLTIRPWEEDDHDLIPDGFETATVAINLSPTWHVKGWEATMRVLTAILRLVPADVCLADQNAASPDLLRLDGVVYVNPNGFSPENLTRFGYYPERVVVGLPAGTVEAAAQ